MGGKDGLSIPNRENNAKKSRKARVRHILKSVQCVKQMGDKALDGRTIWMSDKNYNHQTWTRHEDVEKGSDRTRVVR